MDDGERDDVVGEVADALTLDQDVDWDRCRRQATPAARRSLDNLRLFAGLFPGSEAAEDASPATSLLPFGGVFARRAMQAVMAFAAVEVTATLLLLLWGWSDIRRDALALQLAFLLVGYSVTAGLFLFGRRDRRTRLLGAYFLLQATLANPFLVLGLLREVPPTEPFGFAYFGYPYVYPPLFAPVCLWAFARECPRVHRRTRLDDLARRMVPVSLVAGCVLSVGSVAVLELTRAGRVDPALFWLGYDAVIATSILLALGAVVVVLLRAHTAPAEEARRVALFGTGFVMCTGLSALHHAIEALSPGSSLADFGWSPVLLAAQPLRFPGLALLWCSVLAVRVPHPREAVRSAYRRLLARRGLLAGAAAIPAGALAWLAATRPDHTVGSMAADPLVQSLAAAAGVLLLVSANRERLLMRLDAWIYPDTADQRQTLADAATALGKAERIETLSRILSRAAQHGCGAPAALLLTADAAGPSLDAPDGKVAPLARASAIVHMLEAPGSGSLRVHPNDRMSLFALLPRDDRRWVAETDADVIVGVPGTGAELLGVLAAGRRFDGRIVWSVDVPFLEVLGAAAGLAAGRLMRAAEAGAPDEPPARECPVCRCLTGTGESPACDCGSEYVEAEAPTLLAGKYRLTRRLGTGGTGSAFLARDLRLERDVAVKTLTGVSVQRLMGLKSEAWAMATVNHPAIAHVHGIESWRSRPFLVAELLPGGTLADRLRRGPVPAARAVDIAVLLADALAALHEAGYMHGDIKPSNVGFTSDGSPKLLDFGLARETGDVATRGGTVRYLSPEVLSGRPADEADDVWSLCVMLHEIATGEHPFAGNGVDEVADRVRRQRLGRAGGAAAGPDASSALVAFTASVLTAPRSARPTTARAFADALHGVRRRQ